VSWNRVNVVVRCHRHGSVPTSDSSLGALGSGEASEAEGQAWAGLARAYHHLNRQAAALRYGRRTTIAARKPVVRILLGTRVL
jgi:hypothetical protein